MEPIVATYYLRNDNGYTVSKIEVTDNDRCLIGNCYQAVSWSTDKTPLDWHFVTGVYCKFDGCTHWNFFGEDYDPEIYGQGDKIDAYYHICGPECFIEHIRNMCFVWKVAETILVDCYADDVYTQCIRENYEVDGFTGELVDRMLKGCMITKE